MKAITPVPLVCQFPHIFSIGSQFAMAGELFTIVAFDEYGSPLFVPARDFKKWRTQEKKRVKRARKAMC